MMAEPEEFSSCLEETSVITQERGRMMSKEHVITQETGRINERTCYNARNGEDDK